MTGNEYPAGYAAIGRTLWMATSNGRLLRVDAATNQVIGSPIDLGKKHSFWDMATIGGKLYTTEIAGWLLRIDPQTGRITGRRHLAGELTFIKAVNGILWVIGTPLGGSTGTLMRVDPGTLRVIGKPVKAIARPIALEVRGSVAWMLGGASSGELARVDVRSGARKLVNVGPNPASMTLDGNTIWETDRFDGTLAALDARSLTFRGDVVHTPRAAYGVLVTGDDIWVTAADSLDYTGTRLRLERFDSRTGRRVGTAVAVGNAVRRHQALPRIAVGGRRRPASCGCVRPPRDRHCGRNRRLPRRLGRSPQARLSEERGARRAFRLRSPSLRRRSGWLVTYPEPDTVSFQETGARFTELDFTAPLQVFTNDVALHAVGNPASLLRILQKNPRITVSAVHHLTIGGVPAVRFEIRARAPIPRHPEVCGPFPCVLLFPTHDATYAVVKGDVPTVSVLRVGGRTLVLWEGGNGRDPVAFASAERLLRTAVFKR